MILLTFFDDAYLAQGQVMLRSFMQHTSERFKICVLWLGKRDALSGDHNIEVVMLNQFINSESRLFEARDNRSWRSFCWTLEPALVHSCLKAQKDGEIVVYCDADVMWYADPIPDILAAMERADVALSPHRFPKGQEHRYRSVGKFNFGVAVMRACDLTRKVVGEWLDQTLEKCDEYAGGDQIHLDLWIDKLGMRLTELPATWNAAPWQHVEVNGSPPMIDGERLVSWHYHEHRRGLGKNPIIIKGEPWCRSGYDLPESTVQSVYLPYQMELEKFLP